MRSIPLSSGGVVICLPGNWFAVTVIAFIINKLTSSSVTIVTIL